MQHLKLLLTTLMCSVLLYGCSSSNDSLNASDPMSNIGDNVGNNIDTNNDFCPVGASYDAQEDSCFIDCTDLSDEQCDVLDAMVFGDFDEFIDENYQGDSDIDNVSETNNDVDGEAQAGAIAQYSVGTDLSLTLLENSQPADETQFREIWATITKLLPIADLRDNVSQYHIDSDGEMGTLAYVTPDTNSMGKWIIAFDNADYTNPRDQQFVHTIIHEFGHIAFLQASQVDMSAMGSCPNYSIDEGCTNTESFINRFYQQFWTDIIDEHATITNDTLGEAFYEKYSDQFVSNYAVTNPVEDAAEVFTYFVLRDKPTDMVLGTDRKILFMHNIEELKNMRNIIRGKLKMRTSASTTQAAS